jgi:uncharacterized protein YPO0396
MREVIDTLRNRLADNEAEVRQLERQIKINLQGQAALKDMIRRTKLINRLEALPKGTNREKASRMARILLAKNDIPYKAKYDQSYAVKFYDIGVVPQWLKHRINLVPGVKKVQVKFGPEYSFPMERTRSLYIYLND